MSDEEGFLHSILVSPEEAMHRLVYADWLEERGDPRAQYLRTTTGDDSGAEIELSWLAFMNTLGHPLRPFCFWNNSDPQLFDPEELPFTSRTGMRGSVVTFEGEFRGDSAWDLGLPRDLLVLTQLQLHSCYYGAANYPIHPFICELATDRRPLTGADVLSALKARDFRSEHIRTLDAAEIPYPGYQPNTVNDEAHTDFAEQYLFGHEDKTNAELAHGEDAGAHGVLKRYIDGRMWYVLLHLGERPSNYVVLFAVGRSPHGKRLIGVVTHQVCHNLCD